MLSLQNKTLPRKNNRERNEEICEKQGRVLDIKLVVEPVVVRLPMTAIKVQIADIEVAVRVAVTYKVPSA